MTPLDYPVASPLQGWLRTCDRLLWRAGGLFWFASCACLAVMVTLTTTTIVLRVLDTSAYWIFPWTVVFFVWMTFFGFFAYHARLQDIRVSMISDLFGPRGQMATRILADLTALLVVGVVLYALPDAWRLARGHVDGTLLPRWISPDGELPRRSFYVPLILSCAGIALSALLDLAKCAAGLPENLSDTHPEA